MAVSAIVLLYAATLCIVTLVLLKQASPAQQQNPTKLLVFQNNLPLAKRNENPFSLCDGKTRSCEADADCTDICVNGRCGESDFCIALDDANDVDCDPRKGLIKVIVGDPLLGVWNRQCMSVDPGIALPDGRNLMCAGVVEQPVWDYTTHFPTIADCAGLKCERSLDELVTVQGNRHMRPYAVCSGGF